jgi:hypothetical protein
MIRPLAEQIMLFFVEFFRINRLGKIEVPLPTNSRGEPMSDAQIQLWLDQKWSLYYRPASSVASFTDMMDYFTGTTSWTASTLELFREASWEPTEEGYWFWADISYESKNVVAEDQISEPEANRFLCIEEYLIFHFATDHPNPLVQNYPMWLEKPMWLRTRVNKRLTMAHSGYRTVCPYDKKACARVMKR